MMNRERVHRVRTLSLLGATILLGISWSFAMVHIKTSLYPLFWAAAMPLLALYYFAGEKRLGSWKHLPAAAISIYAVMLWQVTRGYGSIGPIVTVLGVLGSLVAAWLGGRLSSKSRADTAAAGGAVPAPVRTATPAALGSGVARRRRLRTAGLRQ